MHGNLLNKNKLKLFNTANSDLAARILILENNVYKITYYEIISGASGTLTVPTAATINANEFSGANCILSEIDVNNKPTWVSPKDAGGTVVTATLNTGTGAWVKSGVTVSANVALIYSINIAAKDYSNVTNFYIIDETVIGDFSYVLNNTTTGTVSSSLLANAMSDETGSGALVFGTSPTFTTDITTPLIIGGSAVGSTIQYKGTSGNGTSTVAAHQFLVGNNGATTAASIYNSGQVSIGNYASPNNLRLVTIGQDTAYMSLGSLVGATSQWAIYGNTATPSVSNYSLRGDGNDTVLHSPNGSAYIGVSGGTQYRFSVNNITFTPTTAGSSAITPFTFTVPANTGQTASTEIPNFKVNGASKTWAAGAITTQRWNYFTANTAAFASASTVTYSYGFYAEKAVAGTNATITYNIGIGTDGDLLSAGNYHWQGTSTPTTTNYTSYKDAATAIFNGGDNVALSNNGTTYLDIRRGGYTSGTRSGFTFSHGNNTGQTASTEINGYLYNSYSRQWATGAITTQRERYYKSVTYSFVGASTITNAYGAYFEAPTAGTNATITNNWALGTNGNIWIDSSSASIYLGNITPSSSNYALSYTAANEVSVNAPTTGRIRAGGTIAATWSATDFNVNGAGGLSIVNNSNDSKIAFTRTSGNTHSIQLSTTDYYLYNNTAAAIRYGVTNAGNFYIGAKSALATTATDGFLYVPSCAGAPTGVPTAITGKIPIVADSTNNKLYIYSGGAWVALN